MQKKKKKRADIYVKDIEIYCQVWREALVSYRVLSEIHSSLTSSFSRGITLITSPPRVLTKMLLPTASSTSMDSVFL